jgi:hypothetical protein
VGKPQDHARPPELHNCGFCCGGSMACGSAVEDYRSGRDVCHRCLSCRHVGGDVYDVYCRTLFSTCMSRQACVTPSPLLPSCPCYISSISLPILHIHCPSHLHTAYPATHHTPSIQWDGCGQLSCVVVLQHQHDLGVACLCGACGNLDALLQSDQLEQQVQAPTCPSPAAPQQAHPDVT